MAADNHGFVIWITGLPASGKSSLAHALQKHLRELQIGALVLDANDLRPVLTPKPDYTDSERRWFYNALTYMAAWLSENGQNVIIAATGNLRAYRQQAREQIPHFAEVYVTTPLDICQERDGNGQYVVGTAVDEDHLPGVGVPYEPPLAPEAEANLVQKLPSAVAESIVRQLQMQQIIPVGVERKLPLAA